MVTLQLKQLDIPLGQRVLLHDVNWSELDAYQALQVPELWRYENNQLQINVLQNGKYVKFPSSPIFPGLPIVEMIAEFVAQSATLGRSPTLRNFRDRIRRLEKSL